MRFGKQVDNMSTHCFRKNFEVISQCHLHRHAQLFYGPEHILTYNTKNIYIYIYIYIQMLVEQCCSYINDQLSIIATYNSYQPCSMLVIS